MNLIAKEGINIMSVREYIGARYVPMFADPIQWDITSSYEPLTVVMNEGTSYVSKKSVPAGIEITNDAYWLVWADYNAQIEAYRQEVLTFDGRIDDLEDGLPISNFDSTNTVKKYIDDNIDDVEDIIPASSFDSTNTVKKYIDDNIDDVEVLLPATSFSSANTVKKYIDDKMLEGGVAIAFGDSTTRGYGLSEPATQNWFNQLCIHNGWTGHNYAVDGSAFSRVGAQAISTQVATALADSSLTPANVKYVFISGGINDRSGSKADIESGISATITACRTGFPNAKIYAVPCICASNPLNNINQGDSVLTHRFSTYVVNNFFRRYSKVYTFTGAWRWLQDALGVWGIDQVHPNQNGHLIIANTINSELHGAHAPNSMDYIDLSNYIGSSVMQYLNSLEGHIVTDGVNWIMQGKYTIKAQTDVPENTAWFTNIGNALNGDNRYIVPIIFQDIHGIYGGFVRNGEAHNYCVVHNAYNTAQNGFFHAQGVLGL